MLDWSTKSLLAAAVATAVASPAVIAADAGTGTGETGAASLGPISVTATRNPIAPFDYPGMVSVVDAETIRERQPSSLDDVLGGIPNVEFTGGPQSTGVREFIQVVDLARGHLAALDALPAPSGRRAGGGVMPLNLGTGRGYSVLEIVRAFEHASGRRVPYAFGPRRPVDVAACYADPALAAEWLGWRAGFGIERICADAWRWQQRHPDGHPASGQAA